MTCRTRHTAVPAQAACAVSSCARMTVAMDTVLPVSIFAAIISIIISITPRTPGSRRATNLLAPLSA